MKSNENGMERSYSAWITDLKRRYRATQIKAAVAVNSALIEFYWDLGKDISEKFAKEAKYGSRFFQRVSHDMRTEFPNDSGFSPRNIRYCQSFYRLYSAAEILQQVVAKSVKAKRGASKMPQVVAECGLRQLADGIVQQVVAQLVLVPWGHHCTIIDKCKGDREKALFYVRRTIQNGWSRNSLLNWLSTDLYEREGKVQTNFELWQSMYSTRPVTTILLDFSSARNIIVSLQSIILRNLVCQWGSLITSLRRCFPPRRNWQSALLMRNIN